MERAPQTSWSAAILAVLAGAGLAFTALGCSKVSEAAPHTEKVAETPAAAAIGPAAASFDTANYRAAIRSGGPCKKDQTCLAEVVVESKGEYHINDKYPYRFKLNEPPPGLKYPKPVIGKEDGTIEERKAVLKVPFISENAGEKKVSGVLSLSVCSEANCLMDKQPLELSVKVD